MKEDLYNDVVKKWKNSYKRITYKGKELCITVLYHPKPKDLRAFYIGSYCLKDYLGKWHDSTIESIHYDKVVTRFQRFVDEYCTDWEARASYLYIGYDVRINQEKDKEFYIGYVLFHKNSTYKYIANTREEVEVNCKKRIIRVVKEKEKVQRNMLTPKQEKIQELEQVIVRLSSQLEELKNEKKTWVYKGIVLEYGTDEELDEGYSVGRIKNAPEGTREFYGKIESVIKSDLEYYIDELEKSANLYCALTGKEFYINSSR